MRDLETAVDGKGPYRKLPTRSGTALFRGKVLGLQVLRSLQNVGSAIKRHPVRNEQYGGRQVQHRSALRTSRHPAELALQLGKIQNLRVAARLLDGVIVPAGDVFSFWKQVGRATRRRGFVEGRELREGCIVASVGGGLCQLSNALYDLALRAGFKICERHPHTQEVPGSAWELGRDATVAWNHIDLRFRNQRPFQIRARLTADELCVSFGLEAERVDSGGPFAPDKGRAGLRVLNPPPGSCETCGQGNCFRHEAGASLRARSGRERAAFLVDAATPELSRYLSQALRPEDELFVPIDGDRWRLPRYAWNLPDGVSVRAAMSAGVRRALNARRPLSPPEKRALLLADTGRIARRFAAMLRFEATDLFLDIEFLAELYRAGALGGRHVTVWVGRFPLKLLHERLDHAAGIYPDRTQLSDFRALEQDVADEWTALCAAHRIVTPHPSLAEKLRLTASADVVSADWVLPARAPAVVGSYIFFPGPTAAREGAIAVREAAVRLGLAVSVGGRNLEAPDFWSGVEVLSPVDHPIEGALAVVCPAIMKGRPAALLAAMAAGKPIVATAECGVRSAIQVPFGDADALVDAISRL